MEGVSYASWPVMVRGKNGEPDKVLVPPDAKSTLIAAVHRSSHHGQGKTFSLVTTLSLLLFLPF